MDDGTENETGPGDCSVIPPGHNAWVIENEPCTAIDFTGAKDTRRKHKYKWGLQINRL